MEAKEQDQIQYDTETISDLYLHTKNSQDTLQSDVDRFESLQSVHEQSAFVITKIKEIQNSQAKILDGIKEDRTALDAIKESFAINIEIMKENLQNIKDRINKLP